MNSVLRMAGLVLLRVGCPLVVLTSWAKSLAPFQHRVLLITTNCYNSIKNTWRMECQSRHGVEP